MELTKFQLTMNNLTPFEMKLSTPLTWRNCPKCGVNLVDAEISEALKHTCEPEAFHSRLLGDRDDHTWKIKH